MWEFRFQSDSRLFSLHKPILRLLLQFEYIDRHIFSGISDYFRLILTNALTPLVYNSDWKMINIHMFTLQVVYLPNIISFPPQTVQTLMNVWPEQTIACDPNAQCYNSRAHSTCYCRPGYREMDSPVKVIITIWLDIQSGPEIMQTFYQYCQENKGQNEKVVCIIYRSNMSPSSSKMTPRSLILIIWPFFWGNVIFKICSVYLKSHNLRTKKFPLFCFPM